VTTDRVRGRRSLGFLADASLIAALAAVIVGALVIWASFSNLIEDRKQLLDRLEPALVNTEKLRTALLDQQTGVRGFARTRLDSFLDPYRSGQEAAVTISGEIGTALGEENPRISAQLSEIGRAAENWRLQVAEPIIAATNDEGDEGAAQLAKVAFDEVRNEVDELERLVVAEHRVARENLDRSTTILVVAIGVSVGAMTAAGLFGSWLLRRRVVAPLEELVSLTDAVDAGHFDIAISVSGPKEIERLAARVDDMRVRILEELALVERAKAELAEQSQSLERSNRDLEQFAYVASHDLQEPLRKVASFCQLIEQRYDDQLDDTGKLYIEYAVDGSKRMQALISDLLDFSRVGRNTDKFVDVDLEQLTDAVLAAHSDAIEEVDAEVGRGPLPTVPGDPALLAALISNLLGNALKYRTPDLAPKIHIEARRDGDDWEFAFSDNGIGIAENYRERVFVIFQRLHGRDAFAGTGIGLALCKKIIEFHRGQVWIAEPDDPTGTVVRWTLPATSRASDAGYADHVDGAPNDIDQLAATVAGTGE